MNNNVSAIETIRKKLLIGLDHKVRWHDTAGVGQHPIR